MKKTDNQPKDLIDETKITEPRFSMEKTAELIGVHVSTISRLMDDKALGYYKVGRRRIVGQSHLRQYLSVAEHQAKATL